MCIDFFVSHSKEIKHTIAIPLSQTLSSLGFNTWIDQKWITTGTSIYQEIENAISKSTYCIAIIDEAFLSRKWPQKELQLFREKNNNKHKNNILPIYVNLNKLTVYKTLSWLENQAFEELKNNHFNNYADLEIICRIVGRYYGDIISTSLEKIAHEFSGYTFSCKNTLMILLNNKEYFSTDLRIAIIDICNIGGVVYAIYKSLTKSPNQIIDICFRFCNMLRDACFDTDYPLSYSMYTAASNSIVAAMEQLKVLLNVC
ncbi:toll/interleukin-1 receptor domain-containing protein [Anaerovorax odorimutans]|uniref:Toll/interleukin-1 receptor domain-containing protein n=1 Tax=Anaerovorax odorimutans TaxID=109327 RepID=A0ABT1RTT3_9FIRM|nr:toll/interleukin-1 receptor domain-containing protein [Anaerovorax odorimutans]MCQ4638610.1 toll/interleukin-1 receptor domain-containing protein [Anaerovorax odorimutans]